MQRALWALGLDRSGLAPRGRPGRFYDSWSYGSGDLLSPLACRVARGHRPGASGAPRGRPAGLRASKSSIRQYCSLHGPPETNEYRPTNTLFGAYSHRRAQRGWETQ